MYVYPLASHLTFFLASFMYHLESSALEATEGPGLENVQGFQIAGTLGLGVWSRAE